MAVKTSGFRLRQRESGQLGELELWDAQTGEELLTINGGSERHAVVFSPDGYLLASDAGEAVKIYDAGKRSTRWRFIPGNSSVFRCRHQSTE